MSIFTTKLSITAYRKDSAIQIYILYPLLIVCNRNEYRPIRKEVTWLYKVSFDTHEEAQKFRTVIGCSWVVDIDTIWGKSLRSTMLNERLVRNRGNADVLHCPLKYFKRHRPQLYDQRDALFTIYLAVVALEQEARGDNELHSEREWHSGRVKTWYL